MPKTVIVDLEAFDSLHSRKNKPVYAILMLLTAVIMVGILLAFA